MQKNNLRMTNFFILVASPCLSPCAAPSASGRAITAVYLANLFITHHASPSFPLITLHSALNAASRHHSDYDLPRGPGVKRVGTG
ncbi:Uncharacterized protein DAT39_015517, partial [Clarias magur]